MTKEYNHCSICDMFYHPDLFVRSASVCEKCLCKYFDNYIENVFDILDEEPEGYDFDDGEDFDDFEPWEDNS